MLDGIRRLCEAMLPRLVDLPPAGREGTATIITEHDQRIKRVSDFLTNRMTQVDAYHHHKETMAHSAVLVSVALVAGILSVHSWPPDWVPTLPGIRSRCVAFTGAVVPWVLVHFYIRWQLRNRRAAAIQFAALVKTLRGWAMSPPTAEQLKAWEKQLPRPARIHICIDFIIPWGRAQAHLDDDDELRAYPTVFIEELLQSRTAAIKPEIIVTVGSIVLGVVLVARTFPW